MKVKPLILILFLKLNLFKKLMTLIHTKFEINKYTCIYIDYTYIYMSMNKAIETIKD